MSKRNIGKSNQFGGTWTEKKLDIIKKYLAAYTTALKNQPFKKIYIDAFAGNGFCKIHKDGQDTVIEGSASIALSTEIPFEEYYFLEEDAERADQLRALAAQHPEKTIHIYNENCNKVLPDILQRSWRDCRAFLFLDPYGLNIDWKVIQLIAETKAIDVWFLVSLSGVYRNAPHDADKIDKHKQAALDRFLGSNEWREKFYEPTGQGDLFNSSSQERRVVDWRDISHFIQGRLEEIFEGGVNNPTILYSNNVPFFALYFALSNPGSKAKDLAKRMARDISPSYQM